MYRRGRVAESSVEAISSDRDVDQVHSQVDIGLEKGPKVAHDKDEEKSSAVAITKTVSGVQDDDGSIGHENGANFLC